MSRPPVVATEIIALMQDSPQHAWDHAEIQAALWRQGIKVNASTIHRALRYLVQRHLILSTAIASHWYFETSTSHHEHLVCLQCGRLQPIPCATPPSAPVDFVTSSHQINIFGTCFSCAEAKPC